MTRILLLALALVAAQDARAAGRIGGAPGAGFTAGQDVTGDDGVFKTLQSTGTAPSLTATGASFRDSITVKAGSATLVSTEAGPTNSNLLGAALLVGGDSTLFESVGLRVRNFTGISGSGFVGQLVSKGNSAMEVFTIGAAPLVFGTNSAEAFRLSAANIPTFVEGSAIAGSVTHTSTMTMRCGAGTTRCPIGWASSGYAAPSDAGVSNGDKLSFYDADSDGIGSGEKYVIGLEPGFMWFQASGGGAGAGDGFKWYTQGASTMTLKGGNLGIGTASPSKKVHVSSGSIFVDGTPGVRQFNALGWATEGGAGVDSGEIGIAAQAAGGIRIGFNGNTGGNAFWDLINAGAHIWRYSGTTEAMRLTNGGLLGIGTASPNAKLDVTGAAMFGTGGTQSTFTATGFFQPYSRTTLQLSLLAPSAVGQYIDNSTLGALCRSTGTSAGNWALATAAGTGCF